MAWGCLLETRYFDAIIDLVDVARLGLIEWAEFIRVVRGPLPPQRSAMIADVFARLDRTGEGKVSLDDLSFSFNGASHPLVSLGGMPEQEAFAHFLKSMQVGGLVE